MRVDQKQHHRQQYKATEVSTINVFATPGWR
jgi:hypothetical protein